MCVQTNKYSIIVIIIIVNSNSNSSNIIYIALCTFVSAFVRVFFVHSLLFSIAMWLSMVFFFAVDYLFYASEIVFVAECVRVCVFARFISFYSISFGRYESVHRDLFT